MSQNIGCLGSLLKLFGIVPKSVNSKTEGIPMDKLPYKLRDDFLSFAERSFYKTLTLALKDESVIVFSKVSLGDLFFINSKDYKQKMTYWNKINRKHVDFLICDDETLKPLVGIELDDSTHERKDRQLRDQFVDRVFETANLPLIHIKVKRDYAISDLQENLKNYINQTHNVINTLSPSTTNAPICPKCQVEMVVRETKKGKHAGQKFYGCINYPHCREMKPF